MEMKTRGFTLIEMVIYFGISAVALGLIVSMFTIAGRTQRQTYSQYLVGGSLSSTVRLLRREIQATALSSIRVYPEQGTEAPGLSCVSAYDEEGQFKVSGHGVPHWQKHVFYTLNPKGSLIRWSQAKAEDDFLPLPSDLKPSSIAGKGKSAMAGLLPANKAVDTIQEATPFGGFEVGFVRRDNGTDSISRSNPSESDEFDSHTRLVEIVLRTLEERSQPDFSEIRFRVCPRY